MKLSILVPVYNEIKTIDNILKKIKSVKLNKEIIIVDDHSSDGTIEYLKKLKNKNIKVLFNNKNMGKGYCVRRAINHATGDISIIQDADLEYDPNDYYNLVEPIVKNKAHVVYGTRFPKGRKKKISSTNPFFIGNRILTFGANILYNANITDEPTCYKEFKNNLLKNINLKSNRFEICAEITAKIKKKRYKIYEVPIKYNPRTTKEGKKINWKDGLIGVWTLIKYRFRN